MEVINGELILPQADNPAQADPRRQTKPRLTFKYGFDFVQFYGACLEDHWGDGGIV